MGEQESGRTIRLEPEQIKLLELQIENRVRDVVDTQVDREISRLETQRRKVYGVIAIATLFVLGVFGYTTIQHFLPDIVKRLMADPASGELAEVYNDAKSRIDELDTKLKNLGATLEEANTQLAKLRKQTNTTSRVIGQVEQEYDNLREYSKVAALALLAQSGNRVAYDELARYTTRGGELGSLSIQTRNAVMLAFNSPMYVSRKFEQPKTREQLVQHLKSPDALARWAAIDSLANMKGESIAPNLVQIIFRDPDLNVCRSAFFHLNQLTGQSFTVLDFESVKKWWSENKSKYR